MHGLLQISEKYLEKIFSRSRAAKLILIDFDDVPIFFHGQLATLPTTTMSHELHISVMTIILMEDICATIMTMTITIYIARTSEASRANLRRRLYYRDASSTSRPTSTPISIVRVVK